MTYLNQQEYNGSRAKVKKGVTGDRSIDVAFIGGRGFLSLYGGVENAIREIVTELSKRDLTIAVLGVDDKSNEYPFTVPANLRVIKIPLWVYRRLGQHGLITASVLTTILKLRPRVVILFASGPCVFAPLLKLFGVRVITSLRAVDSERNKWGFTSRLILRAGEYCAWRFADTFTVNSREMQTRFLGKRSDVKYLPNGSRAAFEGNDSVIDKLGLQSDGYFLFAARLDPVKRLHLLLEAHAQLPERLRIPLIIAGGHSKSRDYFRDLQDYISDKVIFVGHVDQETLSPLMRHCRAFILPSVLEGMSNSLLSAMATGKAVLASDIRPNKDVLKNDEAIFIADDVVSLSTGLLRLSEQPEFAHKLGEQLQVRAKKNYDWQRTANILSSNISLYL